LDKDSSINYAIVRSSQVGVTGLRLVSSGPTSLVFLDEHGPVRQAFGRLFECSQDGFSFVGFEHERIYAAVEGAGASPQAPNRKPEGRAEAQGRPGR
jgi:hypothetical protein